MVFWPNSVMLPSRGGVRPMIERMVVVLPAPLRPSSATSSPSRTCMRDAVQDVAFAVIGVDVFRDEHRVMRRLRDRPTARADWRRFPGVALRQHGAVIQHGDPVGDAEDDVHVMLDEQHGDFLVLVERADQLGHVVGLLIAHAGGRLVQQQQFRLAGERDADFHDALVAMAELAGDTVRLLRRC